MLSNLTSGIQGYFYRTTFLCYRGRPMLQWLINRFRSSPVVAAPPTEHKWSKRIDICGMSEEEVMNITFEHVLERGTILIGNVGEDGFLTLTE